MLDIKKNYISVYPEFRTTIPQHDFPDRGNRAIRQRVTVLESKEVKARHAQVRMELGLDDKLQPIKKPVQKVEIDGLAGDPAYYKEVLGNTNLNWEEL